MDKLSLTLILLCIVFLLMLIWIGWALLSRRFSLPLPTWLSWCVERDNPFAKVHQVATIIKHLDLKPGMTVLDVGCGPGRVSIPLAKEVGAKGEVVAMDIQAGMLDKVRNKAKAADLKNIQFLHAGVGEEKLAHNKFDRALMVTVLGEIPNQKAALKEVFSALKPGGILSVTEIIFDPHFQRQSKVLAIATSVGFQEKSLFGNRIAFTMILEKPV